ncbi:copper chaperone PCu(A)C [Vibrio sonorensis]|uniref:copper chaperone PCu(A)C n=1 Tax=Vibrio sonorensis TaxID=1004316 RepID=UPI0008D96398|nr:copper chaperone PCu(A)C [Vibrio sonorensis]
MKLKLISLFALSLMITPVSFAHHDAHHHGDKGDFKGVSQPLANDLFVEDARATETIPGVKVGAGYLTIVNNSNKNIRVTAASTAAAQYTEIHRMFMRDSKMAMRKVEYIEIPANDRFVLKPGGYHLMFMMLNHSLKAGDNIEVELVLDNGDKALITMPVIKKNKK